MGSEAGAAREGMTMADTGQTEEPASQPYSTLGQSPNFLSDHKTCPSFSCMLKILPGTSVSAA